MENEEIDIYTLILLCFNCVQIPVGYYDNALNTDNAWIETRCVAFHDSEGCSADLDKLNGTDFKWVDLHDDGLFHSGQQSILRHIADEHDVYFPVAK